ncbi:hypothetical protein SCHPADRAFT_693900 [Schizopora paradoxa]|uniref:Uncharacterized protein n=1 Tax=Schizopora paradoxa TaxID=27342 RepID=A0A0H2RN79_9AGAM|nr:hypothetical protein SCHPADRAFT_693900 [Schizopora paradoxa]
MMHRTTQIAFSLLITLSLLLSALANTEIRNFDAIREDVDELGWLSLKFKELDWTGLDANTSESSFHVVSAPLGTPLSEVCQKIRGEETDSRSSRRCEHEVWIRLDLDDDAWSSFSKFTLRLSWPAFHSTDFDVEIFSSSEVLQLLGSSDSTIPRPDSWKSGSTRSTRKMFSRIRLVNTGVRNPSNPPVDNSSTKVPFTVKLEPLHFGVLPESVIPTIFAILLVSGTSFLFLVPRVLGAFECISSKAAEELSGGVDPKKTQ